MRATLGVVREDGINRVYLDGRKALVTQAARDAVDRLKAPCTISAEIDDSDGALALVRVLGIEKERPRLDVESMLKARRFADASAEMKGRGARVDADPRQLALRIRARCGNGEVADALRDFHRYLSLAAKPEHAVSLADIAGLIATQRDVLGDAMAKAFARWLGEDPTRRLGKKAGEIWGKIPFELWPTEDLLDHLPDVESGLFAVVLEWARQRAPEDPRIAAAESRLVDIARERDDEEVAAIDSEEWRRIPDVLGAVEKAFGVSIPPPLRRVWIHWEARDADNVAIEAARAFRRLGTATLLVPGARGTKLAEMRRVASELRAKHFADEKADPVLLPVGRDGDAWLGLWLVAPPFAGDFAVLRIRDDVTVVASSTREWLG